jgi:hypothetical protein
MAGKHFFYNFLREPKNKSTCERGRVAEGAHLRVGQSGEQRNDVVHEVLVVDDRVLALLHQQLHELAEVGPELLPLLARHRQRVLAAFLRRPRPFL